MPIERLSQNTYVSVGLVVTIVLSLVSFVYQTAAITTSLENHLQDPALHHNIVKTMQDSYVTRQEIEGRLSGLKEDITEIKEILKQISTDIKK